jgi:hypothetical protein
MDFTIVLPVAKNLELSNQCIKHMLENSNLNILVIDDYGKDEDYIKDSRLSFIHNTFTERQSLVKIWNQCTVKCPTEYIILSSWRERPEPKHFKLIEEKLSEGYAMVALQSLHFFAFSKHLTTVLGFFDEGFTKGQYEDTDYFNRFYMKDLGIYVSNEVQEVPHHSMWLADSHVNKQYFDSKWIENAPNLIQLKEEVNIKDRELYKNVYSERVYKKFNESDFKDPNLHNYYNKLFTNKIRKF